MRDIHISLPDGIKQPHLELPEHVREREVELRVCEIQTQAPARAFAESDEVFVQALLVAGARFGVEPALGSKGVRVREDMWVVVDEDAGHGDRGAGGDGVILELDCAVGGGALEAVADAVAYAETFGDDSGQVGEVFEVYKGGGDGGVRHGLFEFCG